ncbi:MAG: HNH endonuclease [Paludibacter sp.]|nr:HNH endonuclease [Paludibacter sp.]
METTERIFFENGIFENVLEEILKAQKIHPGKNFYIQPYSDKLISGLKKYLPGAGYTWRLYASITRDLTNAHYTAEIIDWEYKPDIEFERLAQLNEYIQLHQKGEECIYPIKNGKLCANLISIRNLQKLENPIPVNRFYKISNGTPLKVRTRSGNWSYVTLATEKDDYDHILKSYLDADFGKKVKESSRLSHDARKQRLEVAEQTPTKIHVVTNSYKRNPDVVAEVLYIAKGKCGLCQQNAPFNKTDGSPYLEVHHWTPLSEEGKDTVENAVALCPNCHKEAHLGLDKEFIEINHKRLVAVNTL